MKIYFQMFAFLIFLLQTPKFKGLSPIAKFYHPPPEKRAPQTFGGPIRWKTHQNLCYHPRIQKKYS